MKIPTIYENFMPHILLSASFALLNIKRLNCFVMIGHSNVHLVIDLLGLLVFWSGYFNHFLLFIIYFSFSQFRGSSLNDFSLFLKQKDSWILL